MGRMANFPNGLRIFSLLSLVLLLLGGFGLLFSDRGNYCEMTYMFEYPTFVPIKIPRNELYPEYALYSYNEGRLAEKARKMRFDGIPVLFLPGNSGSRSQVRSLASVALRMGYSDEHDIHFDFFTVSFNEELSGLYGGVLEKETEFVTQALRKILSLYKANQHSKVVPTSVVLIGHSMGGVIAQRLLVYQKSDKMTRLAITLAAPLSAPILNLDTEMDKFYLDMNREWSESTLRDEKVLLSFGGGAKDYMVPSSLISSNFSDFSGLISAIPGVWVSTDHVSIVWCRQFMIAFNRFLFSIVDTRARKVSDDKALILSNARRYFQGNRSTALSPHIHRRTSLMQQDAFWYEDNRRIYQISRPHIKRMTYLMIRLIGAHTDRFVAIKTVNHEDRDWLFGCTASHTYNNQRTCKNATSLSELTRWTATATGFSKHKLATVHLHDLMMQQPEWTHVVVKISPTREPIELDIDINDYASRNITVSLPSEISFGKTVILPVTEKDAIYYELLLPGMTQIYHAYLLYVEPTTSCGTTEYHVSAEMHVPWAENNEYVHFFTSNLNKPMKLRLFKTSPNVLNNTDSSNHVKVTLLLDPRCTFSIGIEPSRYYSLTQLVKQHYPILLPYIAGILLMATRSMLLSLVRTGACESIFTSLAGETLRPYYAVVFGRLGTMALTTVPMLAYLLGSSGMHNSEVAQVNRSLLSLCVYMAALGLVNVLVAATLVAIVFCSQLAHRVVLRLVWRGGGGVIADKLTSLLHKAPMLVSAALVLSVPTSCGAAALIAGGAFYFFMLSKMYEDYLQDYAFKLLARIGARLRQYFKSKISNGSTETNKTLEIIAKSTIPTENIINDIVDKIHETKSIDSTKKETIENDIESLDTHNKETDKNEIRAVERNSKSIKDTNEINIISSDVRETVKIYNDNTMNHLDKQLVDTKQKLSDATSDINNKKLVTIENIGSSNANLNNTLISKDSETSTSESSNSRAKVNEITIENDVDEELSGLHFHFIMFFLWIIVTFTNIPALLTWARNFKYSMVLKPDTSFYPGIIMSVCAGFLWQINSPRRNLKHYDTVCHALVTLAVLVIIVGPYAGYHVNYIVTAAFALITMQQLFDKEIGANNNATAPQNEDKSEENFAEESEPSGSKDNTEKKMYETMKNMKEKMDFNDTDST